MGTSSQALLLGNAGQIPHVGSQGMHGDANAASVDGGARREEGRLRHQRETAPSGTLDLKRVCALYRSAFTQLSTYLNSACTMAGVSSCDHPTPELPLCAREGSNPDAERPWYNRPWVCTTKSTVSTHVPVNHREHAAGAQMPRCPIYETRPLQMGESTILQEPKTDAKPQVTRRVNQI